MTHQRPPKHWRRFPALTLTEAAAVLGVSRSRAYEMATSGALPTHKDHLGRHRVLPADLERLLAAEASDQSDLFSQATEPRTRALRRRQTRRRPFGHEWLEAVLADPRTDPEAADLARWLASQTDDTGRLSVDAQAALQDALGDA